MSEVFFLLACYGLTFFLCDASIFDKPRNLLKKIPLFDDLLSCYFCTGFWVSLFWYFAVYENPQECLGFEEGISWELWWWALAHVFGGAAFTFAFNVLVSTLEGSLYALQVYTGRFEEVALRIRQQERDMGIDPDALEEDEDKNGE